MNLRKLILPIACLVMGINSANAQTYLFKPDATIGEDASIMTTYGCHPDGYPSVAEIINNETGTELAYSDWTYNAGGCNHGTIRFLIRFTGLNSIPPGATILNATLRFYGMPTSLNWGNSTFPGSPYPLTNPGWVERVTSGWAENTVTWNTQPSTTTTNQVAIPFSTSRFNWDASLNVTNLVQDIRSSGVNDGFMVKLQTEAIYRAVFFASSDHADPTLWPELEVTVCDPSFTYCASSNNPYKYNFSANASGMYYQWYIDGSLVSTSQNFSYNFGGPGNHQVCLKVTDKEGSDFGCERCINLCIDKNEVIDKGDDDGGEDGGNPVGRKSSSDNSVKSFPIGDHGPLQIQSVVPNPTAKSWNITVDAVREGEAEITITDMAGKTITTYQKQLAKGGNTLVQDSEKLPAGVYFIEVKTDNIIVREKLVKQ